IDLITNYDPILLLDCYYMYGFLLQAIERQLRPPRYSSITSQLGQRVAQTWRRGLSRRRWQTSRYWTHEQVRSTAATTNTTTTTTAAAAAAGSTVTQDIEALLILGGMDAVQQVLSHRSCRGRQRALRRFVASLFPQRNKHWRSAWRDLGLDGDGDGFDEDGHVAGGSGGIDLDAISRTKVGLPALHLIWVPQALEVLLKKGVIEEVDFGTAGVVGSEAGSGRGMREFVSGLVGWDVLRYGGVPPPPVDYDDHDDYDDEDEDEEDSEGSDEDTDSEDEDDDDDDENSESDA
ncbi:hypothetical protein LTS18_006037, partial [Coniosporium uncinatum]